MTTTCPCPHCHGAPVWGGGIFVVVENPGCIKGGEGTWGVAGPWAGGPHVGATVPAASREAAEKMAVEMNARGVVFTPANFFEEEVATMMAEMKITEPVSRAFVTAWHNEGMEAAMAVAIANGVPMVKKSQKFNNAACAHFTVRGRTIFVG